MSTGHLTPPAHIQQRFALAFSQATNVERLEPFSVSEPETTSARAREIIGVRLVVKDGKFMEKTYALRDPSCAAQGWEELAQVVERFVGTRA